MIGDNASRHVNNDLTEQNYKMLHSLLVIFFASSEVFAGGSVLSIIIEQEKSGGKLKRNHQENIGKHYIAIASNKNGKIGNPDGPDGNHQCLRLFGIIYGLS